MCEIRTTVCAASVLNTVRFCLYSPLSYSAFKVLFSYAASHCHVSPVYIPKQHYIAMCHLSTYLSSITLPCVTCLHTQYFSTLFKNQLDFREKSFDYKIRVLIPSAQFAWNISYSMKNWHKCTQTIVQCTGFPCQILTQLEFYHRFSKKVLKHQVL
jgi:hypothetical protein